jgi:hypothetical protein
LIEKIRMKPSHQTWQASAQLPMQQRSASEKLRASQKYEHSVEPGQKVSLYLNSDADPVYRSFPVFEITPDAHDIELVILEIRGKALKDQHGQPFKDINGKLITDNKPFLFATHEAKNPDGRAWHEYHAILNGDLWKQISHEYSADEAKGLIPATTSAAVREAVLSIYQKSLKGDLLIKSGTDKPDLHILFAVQDNPRDNINNFNLYTDGLTRVHPQAWLAVIEAAQAANVHAVSTISAWRPNLGSIAHRAGRALDVAKLDAADINRQELRKKLPDTTNVSDLEIKLFAEKEAADQQAKIAKAEFTLRNAEYEKFLAQKAKTGIANPEKAAQLQQSLALAEKNRNSAFTKRDKADTAWNDERNKNEPAAVKSFRTSLLACQCVSQVFDPWFMDRNTHDKIAPLPNLQKDHNETLHADHLHITIANPRVPT